MKKLLYFTFSFVLAVIVIGTLLTFSAQAARKTGTILAPEDVAGKWSFALNGRYVIADGKEAAFTKTLFVKVDQPEAVSGSSVWYNADTTFFSDIGQVTEIGIGTFSLFASGKNIWLSVSLDPGPNGEGLVWIDYDCDLFPFVDNKGLLLQGSFKGIGSLDDDKGEWVMKKSSYGTVRMRKYE